MNDLADAKIIDLVTPSSQLYKTHGLKTKLKNCLTTDLATSKHICQLDSAIKMGASFSLN
jgi:hypothetical protein